MLGKNIFHIALMLNALRLSQSQHGMTATHIITTGTGSKFNKINSLIYF